MTNADTPTSSKGGKYSKYLHKWVLYLSWGWLLLLGHYVCTVIGFDIKHYFHSMLDENLEGVKAVCATGLLHT